jgi:hypothetical protein
MLTIKYIYSLGVFFAFIKLQKNILSKEKTEKYNEFLTKTTISIIFTKNSNDTVETA